VTRVRYSITGSWEKPTITELSKETKSGKAKDTAKSAPATKQGL